MFQAAVLSAMGKEEEALGAKGTDTTTLGNGAVRERDSDNQDSHYGLVLTDKRGQMKEAGVAARELRRHEWTSHRPLETAWWKHKVLGFAVWGSFLKVHALGKFLVLGASVSSSKKQTNSTHLWRKEGNSLGTKVAESNPK